MHKIILFLLLSLCLPYNTFAGKCFNIDVTMHNSTNYDIKLFIVKQNSKNKLGTGRLKPNEEKTIFLGSCDHLFITIPKFSFDNVFEVKGHQLLDGPYDLKIISENGTCYPYMISLKKKLSVQLSLREEEEDNESVFLNALWGEFEEEEEEEENSNDEALDI